jgi:hypothetical protein
MRPQDIEIKGMHGQVAYFTWHLIIDLLFIFNLLKSYLDAIF